MIRGGEAARRAILMRAREAFQITQELSVLVLDKTGSITTKDRAPVTGPWSGLCTPALPPSAPTSPWNR
jgi:hypothetical protein